MREVISKTLWIGNAFDARDVTGVLNLGISAIIDLAMEEPPVRFPRDIMYCRFPLIDGEGNNRPVLQAAIDTIARLVQGDVPTLVACSGGMSRSPAIVAASMARIKGVAFMNALAEITAIGPCDVSPALIGDILADSDPPG